MLTENFRAVDLIEFRRPLDPGPFDRKGQISALYLRAVECSVAEYRRGLNGAIDFPTQLSKGGGENKEIKSAVPPVIYEAKVCSIAKHRGPIR